MTYTRGASYQREAHGEPKLAWYWTKTGYGTCREAKCRKAITFARNVKTGKAMPFDGPIKILETRVMEDPNKRGSWGQAMLVDLAQSHFASCVAAPRFRNTPRVRR